MKLFTLSVLIILVSLSCARRLGSRIIGGSPANAEDFPFAVAINTQTPEGRYFCGGALLNQEWILTSANCVNRVTLFSIHLGSTNLEGTGPNVIRAAADTYVFHPEFNPLTLENDIGLIKLRLPIRYNDYIQPIGLPARDVQRYAVVTAIGWGQTSDEDEGIVNELQTVTLTALSNEECKQAFGDQIVDTMVCIEGNYNQGACNGDIGSPLVQYVNQFRPTVVGISSFVSFYGCENLDPSGYTRTFPYIDWIKNTTGIA